MNVYLRWEKVKEKHIGIRMDMSYRLARESWTGFLDMVSRELVDESYDMNDLYAMCMIFLLMIHTCDKNQAFHQSFMRLKAIWNVHKILVGFI